MNSPITQTYFWLIWINIKNFLHQYIRMTFSSTTQMLKSPLAAHVNSAQPPGMYLVAISCKHTIPKVGCLRLGGKAVISVS